MKSLILKYKNIIAGIINYFTNFKKVLLLYYYSGEKFLPFALLSLSIYVN